MTFEEWMLANFFCEPNWDTPENKLQQSYARLAWNYQQTIIDELQYLIKLLEDKLDE